MALRIGRFGTKTYPVGQYLKLDNPDVIFVPPEEPDPDPDPEPGEGGGTLSTNIAFDSIDPEDKTNVVLRFGMTFKEGEFIDGDELVVIDGVTELPVQVDFPRVHRGHIRAIDVSVLHVNGFTAGELKEFDIVARPGTNLTNVTKTIAQLLAINTNDCFVEYTDLTGKVWTASFREAAAAGSTWTKGSPMCSNEYYHNGRLRKSFSCRAPFRDSEGVAHTYLYQVFLPEATSHDNFTTLTWNYFPVQHNGWVGVASQADLLGSMRVLVEESVERDYTTRNPAATLTITGTSGALSAAVCSVNDVGKIARRISNGAALMITGAGTSGLTLSFPFVSATFPAGVYAPDEWQIVGMRVFVHSHWADEHIYSGNHLLYRHRHNLQQLVESRAIPQYGPASVDVNNVTGFVGTESGSAQGSRGTSYLDGFGNHPYRRRMNGSNAQYGERYVQTNEPEAEIQPYCHVLSFCKVKNDTEEHLDPNSIRRIYENAQIMCHNQRWATLDEGTGLLVNHNVNGRSQMDGDNFLPAGYHIQEITTSHKESYAWGPAIMSGTLLWLYELQMEALSAIFGNCGSGTGAFGRDWWSSGGQFRSYPWADVAAGRAGWYTPASISRALTGFMQSDYLDLLIANWEAAHDRYIDDGTGTNLQSKLFPTTGTSNDGTLAPVFFKTSQTGGSGTKYHMWQTCYAVKAGKHLDELGILSDDGRSLYGGCVANLVEQQHANPTGSILGKKTEYSTGGALDKTWADVITHFTAQETETFYQSQIAYALIDAHEWCLQEGVYDTERTRVAMQLVVDKIVAVTTGGLDNHTQSGAPNATILIPGADITATNKVHWTRRRADVS